MDEAIKAQRPTEGGELPSVCGRYAVSPQGDVSRSIKVMSEHHPPAIWMCLVNEIYTQNYLCLKAICFPNEKWWKNK